MAAQHEHDPSAEKKPVAFTVPFILAAVTLLIILLFLSLCDPSSHHGEHQGHSTSAAHDVKDDGHRHATDKENIKSLGEAEGTEAVPAREQTGTAGE
jgi:hypothetical protein